MLERFHHTNNDEEIKETRKTMIEEMTIVDRRSFLHDVAVRGGLKWIITEELLGTQSNLNELTNGMMMLQAYVYSW